MGFLSFFQRRKDPENFETVLEDLRISINSRRQRLAEMRVRERRATLWTTLYLMAVWIVYTTIWYAGWIHALVGVNRSHLGQILWTKTLITAPVFIGPVAIVFTRRIVQLWYTRIANREEKTLKDLLLEQRAKLEELKKKTDFYSTQKLLERYDRPDGAAPNPNVPGPNPTTPGPKQGPAGGRASLGGAQLMGPPGVPGINGSQIMRTPVKPNGAGPMVTPTPMPPGYMPAFSPVPIAPTPRKWYDRLADAVLGEDSDGTPGRGAQSKYALICKKCFTHNGLVRESELDDTQFICMKCGHLNPPTNSLRSNGLDETPPATNLAARLNRSDSPVSPSPSMATASVTASQLKPRKGYQMESDEDGMDVVPPTPATKAGKGRKSAAAAEKETPPTAGTGHAGAAVKRTGSGRVTRNSRKSEIVGEGMEVD